MQFLELLKAALYGIVEGITEWLPVSSTGHMILLEEILPFSGVSEGFYSMFQVVIQLGAILAVVLLFWRKLWPFGRDAESGRVRLEPAKVTLWAKILLACVPAAVIGLLFDKTFEALFYNYVSVAIALIVFGVAFIVVETAHRGKRPRIRSLARLDYRTVLFIGLFQVIAAIFPGTSRSGATIIGALMLGVSRRVAAEFTFYLAIPVMFGASLLKLMQFGLAFTGLEVAILLVGMAVAFAVSVLVIRFLMDYIRKHDFKVFGWYRIALGAVVLAYFLIR
ncbi:MAG TPA: undecaprenyl-diphosphate phosphatase [Candidatus Faecivicinus avistercoris]|nr:undecaprenyl-diphosphate phosphatase [Candidatus Faecivicinus avistercoris]